eukprot:3267312-Amphidinium_carterae.2
MTRTVLALCPSIVIVSMDTFSPFARMKERCESQDFPQVRRAMRAHKHSTTRCPVLEPGCVPIICRHHPAKSVLQRTDTLCHSIPGERFDKHRLDFVDRFWLDGGNYFVSVRADTHTNPHTLRRDETV